MTTPTEPAAYEIVWSQLAALAQRICDYIEQTPPDLIVVLHKSGVVVGCAVEALWRATRQGPLPRLVAANIGREKGIYLYSDGAPITERSFATAEAVGQFIMGTIMRRPQWPAQLAAQIGAELGDTSVRTILLIDDCIRSGDTLFIASGLLMEIFPHAETTLFAGLNPGWRETLGVQWLEAHHPEVGERMRANWPADREEFGLRGGGADGIWPSLVSGLEAVEDNPFATRPMTAEDCNWPYLTRYLPAEAWLEFPAWVRAQAAACVLKPVMPDIPLGKVDVEGVKRWTRFFAESWRTPYFTLEEIAARAGFTLEEGSDLLRYVEVVAETVNGKTVYTYKQGMGILDFEGLIVGQEGDLAPWVTLRRTVTTPFAVEFAAVSLHYGGGPALTIVPEGQGAPVQARLIGFHPIVGEDEHIWNLVYRTVARPESEAAAVAALAHEAGRVAIENLRDLDGVDFVYYARRPVSLDFIGDTRLSRQKQAERLAQMAVASLTPESYRSGLDGIRYLANAIATGVETPLTPDYVAAVLRLAPGAQSLEEARRVLMSG